MHGNAATWLSIGHSKNILMHLQELADLCTISQTQAKYLRNYHVIMYRCTVMPFWNGGWNHETNGSNQNQAAVVYKLLKIKIHLFNIQQHARTTLKLKVIICLTCLYIGKYTDLLLAPNANYKTFWTWSVSFTWKGSLAASNPLFSVHDKKKQALDKNTRPTGFACFLHEHVIKVKTVRWQVTFQLSSVTGTTSFQHIMAYFKQRCFFIH